MTQTQTQTQARTPAQAQAPAPRNEVKKPVLEVKDRRGRDRFGESLAPASLTAGQAVLVKVRRGTNGEIKKVRVLVFDSLQAAQQALQRRQG